MLHNNLIKKLKEIGYIKVINFLNLEEVEDLKNKISLFVSSKGDHAGHFSPNFTSKLIKIFKLEFRKYSVSNYLTALAKKKNMKNFSNFYFENSSYLKMIDCYYTPISNKDILPWHNDIAFSRDSNQKVENNKNFTDPKTVSLKFFIYLTKVGPNNGCTSFIPKSHIIVKSLSKLIYEKKISYEPYWDLKSLRLFLNHKNIQNYFLEYFGNLDLLLEFLHATKFIEENIDTYKYDFSMNPGDAIIFDEAGIHKGSKTTLNDRLVLRYHYSLR
jgi:hypothetical protein